MYACVLTYPHHCKHWLSVFLIIAILKGVFYGLLFTFPQKNIYFCFTDYAKAFDCVDHNKLWKILKDMGIPDHLTCLLRNLYADQEATVRTGHGTTDCLQIGRGVHRDCILLPCLFNLYIEYIMGNAGLDEAQAEIRSLSITSIRRWHYTYRRKQRTKEPLDEY